MAEKIGDFLIRIGELDTDQVQIICAKQLSGDKRQFGEIGRELGYINKEAVWLYLEAKRAWKAKENNV
jgi:hypothetical protein